MNCFLLCQVAEYTCTFTLRGRHSLRVLCMVNPIRGLQGKLSGRCSPDLVRRKKRIAIWYARDIPETGTQEHQLMRPKTTPNINSQHRNTRVPVLARATVQNQPNLPSQHAHFFPFFLPPCACAGPPASTITASSSLALGGRIAAAASSSSPSSSAMN